MDVPGQYGLCGTLREVEVFLAVPCAVSGVKNSQPLSADKTSGVRVIHFRVANRKQSAPGNVFDWLASGSARFSFQEGIYGSFKRLRNSSEKPII